MRTLPTFQLTGSTSLTMLRRGKDTIVMGRPVIGELEEIEVKANVQPLNFRDLRLLPESERTREWLKVYSAEEMRTALEGEDGWEADEFDWEGKRFRVMSSHRYKMGILDHYVAHAARVRLSAQ